MTRDTDQRPVNPRRQRPLLVISTNAGASTDQQSKGGGQQGPAREEKQAVSPAENQAAAAAQSGGARRQPGFFATVTRSAKEQERQSLQADAGKMRLWRALRLRRGQTSESGETTSGKRADKTAGETAIRGQQKAMLRNVKKSQSGQETTNVSRSAPTASSRRVAADATDQSSRPLLKTRHFVGLFIYIIVATLLEVPLAYISQIFHLNQILFQFSIFSFPVVITQALVIYLVLLVALLIILNHFDLLPFSRTAMRQEKSVAQSGQGKTGAKGKGKKESNKGEHDHLYEDYRDLRRYLRRRARKR
ncbi:hypothetical protein [Thermogemmatispora sp.]|uniref:hypothetical protein n=1 Tax=Thermogemmatispora sp. TaxID=1968838 RepID=UPI001D75E6E3|nr:hypothetical protein [Thermogemmatispora sp.]MBX5450046.1 hypothetical protein [Thermogemmatispora sp.]